MILKTPVRCHALTVAALLLLQACEPIGSHKNGAIATPITAAADAAKAQCLGFMHEDADEYVSCLDSLMASAAKDPSARQQAQRGLGIAYFGWVGANNSARIGLPGALPATARYRRLFRPLQAQLAVSDQVLCSAVAGPCETRLAQLHEQERDDPPIAAIQVFLQH